MDNIEKVFKRVEVRNLREFFSCGTDCEDAINKPYNERIRSAERRLERSLESGYRTIRNLTKRSALYTNARVKRRRLIWK